MWTPLVGAMNGVVDGILDWYYGHNVLGLWSTTLGIPLRDGTVWMHLANEHTKDEDT